MTLRPTPLSDELYDYLVAHGTPPDATQEALIAETATLGHEARLQVSPDEGSFLTLLTKLLGVRTALEIGTFTGYSALCIARGLADGGVLTCCDISEEWTRIARRHWDGAGVSDRIDLKIGPALDTLRSLPARPTYDLAFIDADYPSYPAYWEEVVPRVNTGGVIIVDNVLYHARVIDPSDTEVTTEAVRALNERVISDERVEATMIHIADGITLARKK
ncbi:O-methyltransferase [Actinopolymorpha pittospori]|uniref:Caffeoyl-CoA O-methyltransferase n=1 Tax=Actinopolymorpha pittospori TaxID=648752 RepID=A0A927MXV5_9ACTN|nr:O-methyltransferase [Actinopolymorpha pittospori]MBE1608930.1 caffeoyl-CoA O-methyltransferase [Actinopolymorpha pittospori]